MSEGVVKIPHSLTHETMRPFIDLVLDPQGRPRFEVTDFDFTGRVNFIDPTGVVVLSNLYHHLNRQGARFRCRVEEPYSPMVTYLDDTGFYRTFFGEALRPQAAMRRSTVPLQEVRTDRIEEYLSFRLMPWIAERVGLDEESVAGVKVCFEEILNNITDHSGVPLGSAFAQFFPKVGEIQVAISDFGVGIPAKVRTKEANLSDAGALRRACDEGFTTQSNVRNRGAGLPLLMRYVTEQNGGTVLLASGRGEVLAHRREARLAHRARMAGAGYYPGTLVRVILRTDAIEALEADVQAEKFEW